MSRARTQVYFTEDQRRSLDQIAAREGRTLAEVVREATDRYLARDRRTLDLPADIAIRLEAAAQARGVPAEALAADLLRDALADETPPPRVPLTEDGWGDGREAERVDELLADGFGRP